MPVTLNLEDPNASAGAWSGWRDFRVARRAFEDRGHTQCSFYLEPVDGVPMPTFNPGQYLIFSLPVFARRSIVRCYSLSDLPDPSGYRVTVKRILSSADRPDFPPGASSNYFHDRVHEGDMLKVKAPSGHFFIDPDPNRARGVYRRRHRHHADDEHAALVSYRAASPNVRSTSTTGCAAATTTRSRLRWTRWQLAHPALKLHVVYSSPGPADVLGRDYHHAGHVDLDLLRQALAAWPASVLRLRSAADDAEPGARLREWGVQEDDIHFEAFGPASVRAAGPSTHRAVACHRRPRSKCASPARVAR